MSPEELQALCEEWQKRLRLADWEVKATFKRDFEMDDNAEGQCHRIPSLRRAYLSILDRIDSDTDPILFGHTLEYLVVHELLHLWFDPLCEVGKDTAKELLQEQAVHSIALALTRKAAS